MSRTLQLCEIRGNPLIQAISLVFWLLAALVPALADERVRFPSLDEDLTGGAATELDARLYKPEGDGPFPAVVGMHGCGGRDFLRRDAPYAYVADWAQRLVALGYLVLLPDSFRPRGVIEVCTQSPQLVSAVRHRPRDAYGALAWLRAQPYVQGDRVFLMGWSNGASATLATLRADNFKDQRERSGGDFRAAVALYPGCIAQVKSGWSTKTPLLVMIGEADDWTPAEPCHELEQRTKRTAQPVEFVFYPGAYHGFDAPDHKPVTRKDVPRAQANGKGVVTIAADPPAREDAIKRLPEFFARNGGK